MCIPESETCQAISHLLALEYGNDRINDHHAAIDKPGGYPSVAEGYLPRIYYLNGSSPRTFIAVTAQMIMAV